MEIVFQIVLIITSLLMVLLYSFYTIDVAARKHWRSSTVEAMFSPYYLPKVAVHVPTYNEPFELVQETLDRLLKLDYPADRVVIMVADDSTAGGDRVGWDPDRTAENARKAVENTNGEIAQQLLAYSIQVGDGIIGSVLEARQAEMVNDVLADPRADRGRGARET